MRTQQRRLEAIDSPHWVRTVLDLTVEEGNDQTEYIGEALVSSLAYGHLIEFKVSTSLIRTATLNIPLFVSSDAVASVSLNDHSLNTVRLAASNDSLAVLHHLTVDVTPWTEDRAVSSVRVRLSYERHQGTTTILLDRDRDLYAARITEHFGRESVIVLALIAFAWISILAVAILVVANVRALGESFRFYAVLTVAGGWVASVLGLPDLARIPLRAYLRHWYATTRRRRTLVVCALAFLMLVTSVQAAEVVYCLVVRYRYTQLIASGLNDSPDRAMDAVRQAFILVPWRKEAQILLEAHAYRLRTDASMSALRHFIKGFVDYNGVNRAVQSTLRKSGLPLPLEGVAPQRWLSDPVVWYASLLPEAEGENEDGLLKSAVAELAYRDPPDVFPQAYLLRTSLSLQLQIEDEEARHRLRRDLIEFLNKDEDARLTTLHEFQVACDMIAVSFLHDCKHEDANDWFARELQARERTSYEGYPVWHRPPHKLILFHVFVSYSNIDESDSDLGRRTLDATDGCPAYRMSFEQRLLKENPSMRAPDAWMKNTTLNANLESLVNSTLQMGWRY